jgi:polyhydroxyalkanoate synthesis repressor PhaR
MPVVKRYANRKLYDTDAKRYVTLDVIAELIRRGHEVSVVDHETGADITQQIQAQIIFEEEKRLRGGLPAAVLTGLIRTGSDTLQHLRAALAPTSAGWTEAVEAEIERRLAALVQAGQLTGDEAARWSALLAGAGQLLEPADEQTTGALRQVMAERGLPTKADLAELLDRIEALSAEIDRLNAARGARKR